MPLSSAPTDMETAVSDRYSAGAREVQPALCCPVDYDPRFLAAIPEEVLERDYGCGDPSRYLAEGDTVLDLGCGEGMICFIASQVVGAAGHVIGVDLNDDMLARARCAAPIVAQRIGHDNVEFRKGRIQDLALDLDALTGWLSEHPVTDISTLTTLEAEQQLRRALSTAEIVRASTCTVAILIRACRGDVLASSTSCALTVSVIRPIPVVRTPAPTVCSLAAARRDL